MQKYNPEDDDWFELTLEDQTKDYVSHPKIGQYIVCSQLEQKYIEQCGESEKPIKKIINYKKLSSYRTYLNLRFGK